MSESVTPSPIQEPVSVDDNSSTISVDDGAGTLTVDNAGLTELATAIDTEMQVDVVAALPAGTNNIGDVDIASPVGAGTEAAAVRVTVATDSTGVLSVDDNGTTLSVDDGASSLTVDNATISVVGGGTEATAQRVTIANDSTGVVSVDDNGGVLTVDGTVTANLAAGANNIGDVDIASPLGAGTEAAALRVTVATDSTGVLSVDDNGGVLTVDGTVTANLAAGTNTNEVVGDVAHDAAAAGNPVLAAGVAQANDDTAPPNRVSTESDATRLATDFDGALYVRAGGPQVWSYHSNGSTALTDAVVHAAPGAGLSLYVTDIVFSSGAATAINAFFEEGVTTVLGPWYLEAVAGRGLAIHFNTPKKITANTALTVTTSAAIAHSVDVTGYTAQG
jgi:hypothetical protein